MGNLKYTAMRDITAALIGWYTVKQRDLPWRRTTDPYRIWVSEIMLQQTQVVTAIPYYERFLARFPTVEALAQAALDEVLALWQGLGYYSRARSLYAAAQIVHAQHHGQIPAQRDELLALPGIGEYTTGAILSIAFGRDEPAIDGNVTRVLCRLFAYEGDPSKPAGKRFLRERSLALLPSGRAGDYNQAMMELGATVCTPKSPLCSECPLTTFCRARELGRQNALPLAKPRRKPPHHEMAAALCPHNGAVLIVRRAPQGLLGGLWELPSGEIAPGEDHAHALTRHLTQGLGLTVTVGLRIGVVKHAYTHFRVTVYVYHCDVAGEPHAASPWDNTHWLSPGEPERGLTGITSKILDRLPWPGAGLLL